MSEYTEEETRHNIEHPFCQHHLLKEKLSLWQHASTCNKAPIDMRRGLVDPLANSPHASHD